MSKQKGGNGEFFSRGREQNTATFEHTLKFHVKELNRGYKLVLDGMEREDKDMFFGGLATLAQIGEDIMSIHMRMLKVCAGEVSLDSLKAYASKARKNAAENSEECCAILNSAPSVGSPKN